VKNNQYLEKELECCDYHHDRDHRRVVVDDVQSFKGQFNYKANYADRNDE